MWQRLHDLGFLTAFDDLWSFAAQAGPRATKTFSKIAKLIKHRQTSTRGQPKQKNVLRVRQ